MRGPSHLTAALLTATALALSPRPCTQFSPAPIRASDLPAFFPRQHPTTLTHLAAVEEIRQTLSHYALSIDGRTFSSLSDVFTPDAVADYSAPLGVLTGTHQIQSVLSASLAQFPATQHLLGTQRVRVCGDTAISVTYYRAVHFFGLNATGPAPGVVDDSGVLVAYSQYQDSWVRRNGSWRIGYRNNVYAGPLVTDLS